MAPSITGSVAIIELSKSVTESLSAQEVDDLSSEAADAYGVDSDDVTIELIYQTTGSLDLEIITDVDESELVEALEEEIASLLGVHESNVEVTIDDGIVLYTVHSDSAEGASNFQNILSEDAFGSNLDNALGEVFPVDVSSVNVNDEISVEVVVTVDTSSAENNLNNAAESVEEVFGDQGFDATAESNTHHGFSGDA